MATGDGERARIEELEIEVETLKCELSQAESAVANMLQAIALLNKQLSDARAWISEYGNWD